MGYPAYYGRPALVANYRRATAPASVHLVALFQYIAGLLGLLAAAGIVLLLYGHGRVIDDQQRGQQWARITVLALSLLSIAATAYDAWRFQDRTVLIGLAPPLLYLLLLSTRAARSWFRYGTW